MDVPGRSAIGGLCQSTDIQTAVQACCSTLGRPLGAAEQQLIERLKQNWYSTAADVITMSEAEAQSLRIPMRLLAVLKDSLKAPAGTASASISAPANGATSGSLSGHLEALQASLPAQQLQQQLPTAKRSQTVLKKGLEAQSFANFLGPSKPIGPSLHGTRPSTSQPHNSGPAEEPTLLNGSARAWGPPQNGTTGADPLSYSAVNAQKLSQDGAAGGAELGWSGSHLERTAEQLSVPDRADSAQKQGVAEEAACSEALSMALSGSTGAPQAERSLASIVEEIQNRRCPPMGRFGKGSSYNIKVTKNARGTGYAIKEEDMSAKLKQEFEDFMTFCTKRQWQQQHEPIAGVTAKKYVDHLRRALGWLQTEQGIPVGDLRLKSLLPSSDRGGVSLAFDYCQFLLSERNVSVYTQGLAVRSILQAAKFLYSRESSSRPDEGEKPYNDLLLVRELRKMSSLSKRSEKIAPRAADEQLKWLDWPDFVRVVNELRLECAGKDAIGRARTPTAVAWSLQRYLIFAILCCIPDRQRTLRELEVDRTLFKEGGKWVIKHQAGDYKTGRVYGQRPPMVIAPHIYPELEAFLGHWRQFLQPAHSRLFSKLNGAPMSEQGLYKIFQTSAFRISGKKTNPHLVRDMVVTYLRGAGASERELEALAIYMGHSLEMQRGSYDRRTKAEKVEPAITLLASLYAQNQQAA